MNETEFWDLAFKRGLPRWRWFRKSLSVEDLDRKLAGWSNWESLKTKIQEGDKIWPFHFQLRRVLGDRWGYIVLRRGEFIGGIVTLVS